MNIRSCGVLAHLSSLPSAYGIGDMGPVAYRFVEVLRNAGQSYWQMLPLGPTSTSIGNSPYSSCSAFAGSPLFISPEVLVEDGWLEERHVREAYASGQEVDTRVDYEAVEKRKTAMLKQAFEYSRERLESHPEYRVFVRDNGYWLEDYAMFVVLKERMEGKEWCHWPWEIKDRHGHAMEGTEQSGEDELQFHRFVQFLFHSQWSRLRRHCRDNGIRVVGDLPIYVTHDSSDVWSAKKYFKLGDDGRPYAVAGVPPDYFSANGQRWGNPVYDWKVMREDGFVWWIQRMKRNLELFDVIRMDHFRGFAGYWEIPAHEETAINGSWVEAPGEQLFTSLARHFLALPVIAEDLGVITADVHLLRKKMGFPGMKVLQFAFGSGNGDNPDALHNHTRDSVVYTGTHDNNTTMGWFGSESRQEEKKRFLTYMGSENDESKAHEKMIRLAMMSVADTAIIPMQDVLGLDESARMNTPSVAGGNWEWRFTEAQMDGKMFREVREMAKMYGRMA